MNNLLLFSVHSAHSRAAVWVSSTLTSLTICKAVVQHQNHWISAHFLAGFLYKEQIIFFSSDYPFLVVSKWGRIIQEKSGGFNQDFILLSEKTMDSCPAVRFWEDLTCVSRSCLWWFLYNFYLSHWRAAEENAYKKRKETIKNIDDVKYPAIYICKTFLWKFQLKLLYFT